MSSTLYQVTAYQTIAHVHHLHDVFSVETNASYVQNWAICQIIAMIVCSMVQVFSIRRLFLSSTSTKPSSTKNYHSPPPSHFVFSSWSVTRSLLDCSIVDELVFSLINHLIEYFCCSSIVVVFALHITAKLHVFSVHTCCSLSLSLSLAWHWDSLFSSLSRRYPWYYHSTGSKRNTKPIKQ